MQHSCITNTESPVEILAQGQYSEILTRLTRPLVMKGWAVTGEGIWKVEAKAESSQAGSADGEVE